MEWEDTKSWSESFDEFMSQFDDLFLRSESREKAKLYVRGLLADVERKNAWQLAEVLNLDSPHPLQRLVNEGKWDEDRVQKRKRQVVNKRLSAAGVIVIDESGFVKKGTKSAGVARQYCGRVGKVENCQVGVYLVYASPTASVFLDRRLYLPKVWCEDAQRRQEAAIPSQIEFRTKPELAQDMLDEVWAEGSTAHYVTGDSLYGNSPGLRNFIDRSHHSYVMAIGSQHRVFYQGSRQALKTIAQAIPSTDWEKIAFTLTETGWIWYEWTACRIEMANDEIGEQWLLIRRRLGEQQEFDFFLSNAPPDSAFTDLVAVALMRHQIEQSFEEAKEQLGLADYEVRTWHGWHRHMTLCFLAHTWLTLMSMNERQKKATSALDELQSG
ncbi:MAG: IS701 family transposase [Anaerolineae bacterium]|nr:IS701 family transposase [Anaerolineae bacterium]